MAQADAPFRRPVALHECREANVVAVDDLIRAHVAQQLLDVLRRLALHSRSTEQDERNRKSDKQYADPRAYVRVFRQEMRRMSLRPVEFLHTMSLATSSRA